MNLFWIALAAAVLCSAIGFKYYIWFISIGYGLSIAGIGIVFLAAAFTGMGGAAALYCPEDSSERGQRGIGKRRKK